MMLVVELMTNGNLRDYIPPIRSRYIQTHTWTWLILLFLTQVYW